MARPDRPGCRPGDRLTAVRHAPAGRRGGLRRGHPLGATAAFLGVGLLLPRRPTTQVAALAMTASVAVEVGQLYHAPWIDSIRRTAVGGLALSYGFLLSDLACYAVGVGLGILIEQALLQDRSAPRA